MSIRIHKALGWGLNDVEAEGCHIKDSRFHPDILDDEYEWWENEDQRNRDFMNWIADKGNQVKAAELICRANGEDIKDEEETFRVMNLDFDLLNAATFWSEGEKNKVEFESGVIYQGEFGLSNVCLFKPIIDPFHKFFRWDDYIDYYEAGSDSSNKVQLLTNRCGIYPYVGMLRIPGTKPSHKKFGRYMDPAMYNRLTGVWDESQDSLVHGEFLEDLLNNYRPRIHPMIMIYTQFIGIFADWEKTIQQLRPMIYTYWS